MHYSTVAHLFAEAIDTITGHTALAFNLLLQARGELSEVLHLRTSVVYLTCEVCLALLHFCKANLQQTQPR